MNKRVVITGLGVVAPNGVGVPDFLHSIQNGISGLQFVPEFEELNFNCQVSGIPDFSFDMISGILPEVILSRLRSWNIGYGIKAAHEAWTDAGMALQSGEALWDTGCVFGNSVPDSFLNKHVIESVDKKESRKLGSRVVEQIMTSGASAYIAGIFGLGNRVLSNSSACATGTQSILTGYEHIKYGLAKRMVVGSCESVDKYIFSTFDSMRVLSRKFNQNPGQASRPMSASAGGFVPGSGAGALILEELDTALQRNAKIYAEIIGGASNSGGQKSGGSMTAPNSEGVVKCISEALLCAGISGSCVDLVNGHLTATMGDKIEIQNWIKALDRKDKGLPLVNSVKSMVGHCLSAAGSIESIAAVLQISDQFIHPNINLEDPNPEITDLIGTESLPVHMQQQEVNIVAKANFGFGDVNACLIFSKFN